MKKNWSLLSILFSVLTISYALAQTPPVAPVAEAVKRVVVAKPEIRQIPRSAMRPAKLAPGVLTELEALRLKLAYSQADSQQSRAVVAALMRQGTLNAICKAHSMEGCQPSQDFKTISAPAVATPSATPEK
jgi:hypothetical protein